MTMHRWAVAAFVVALGATTATAGDAAPVTTAKKPATARSSPSTHTTRRPSTTGKQRLDGVAAVVQGEPIFDSEVDEQLYLLVEQTGARPDSQSALAMRKEILDRLVNEKLIVQEAKKKAVTVSDADLDKQVDQAVSDAKDRLGGDAGYRSELAKEGISEADLRERYRGEIRRRMLADQLLRKELNLKLEVTPAEAEAYFKTNPADFPKKPAELGLAVIQIPVEPESTALAAARKRATDILARLQKGESFARLAQENSEDPATRNSGGDLGFFARGQLDSTFESIAFSLKPGQTSGVVQTTFGFHIIRVEEADTSRNEIHARHILIRAPVQPEDEKRAAALAQRAHDEAARGVDFAQLVNRYSKYKGPSGPGGNLGYLPATAFPPEFRVVLDTLGIGHVSPPLLSPQGYHVFKMLDRHPERPYQLDEVKSQLPDLVRQIKLQKQYDTWVASLRSRARVEYK